MMCDWPKPFHGTSMIAVSAALHLQEGPVLARADQALARSQTLRNRLFDLQQRARIPGVVFDPLHVEAFERAADLDHALWAEVVVQVERDLGFRPDALAEGGDQRFDLVRGLRRSLPQRSSRVRGRSRGNRSSPARRG